MHRLYKRGGDSMTKKGTKKNPAARRLVGKLFAMLAATAALAAAGAALMAGGSIPEEKLGLLAQGITGAVSLACGWITSAKAAEKKLLHGLIGPGLYLLVLLLGNLLFYGVGYENLLPVGLTVLAAGVGGSILGSLRRKKRKFV